MSIETIKLFILDPILITILKLEFVLMQFPIILVDWFPVSLFEKSVSVVVLSLLVFKKVRLFLILN